MQSFITGQLYVALDILPESEARLVAPPDARYPEIPAILTKGQQIERTVRSLVDRLQKLPFEDIVEKLDSALGGIDRVVNDPRLTEAIANLDATLAEARGAVADARALVNNVDGRVEPITDSAVAVLDQAQQTLESIETTLEPGSPLSYQLAQTLRELQEAARSLRVLADYLERHPNSLVFGRTAVEQ
jgi:paraquat-inducible protein B